jgi:hypothetical protein
MGVGKTYGGKPFTFDCQPGNCIVGYWGVIGQKYIGLIGFVQRHEFAATGVAMLAGPVDDDEPQRSPPI